MSEISRLKYNKYGKEGQLYDALATGCKLPFAEHTIKDYNDEVESDIKYLLRSRELIDFKDGELRCRNEVTPLYMACSNINIPIHIIDLLLSSGASTNEMIKVNGNNCYLIDDLEICLSRTPDRFIAIRELFDKYDKE